MQIKIEAVQIAESFNIKKFRAEFRAEAESATNSEVFYAFADTNRFLYVFDYGVVVFANYDELAKSEFVRFVKNYATTLVELDLFEEYRIELDTKLHKPIVKNDYVSIHHVDPSVLRIVMLNTGQSVALEYYEMLTDDLITSSKLYIQELEQRGKLSISKTNLLKYIGKVLNVKNSIVDNLYILDDPNLVWDNEELNLLNRNLKANFDINTRFKDLDYRLQIVEDNLKLFTDVLNVRESRQRRRIGDCRARQRRHQACRQDRHIPQAAPQVPHHLQRQIDDPLRQPSDVHDLPGQHEERHRQQRKTVRPVDHVLRQDLRIEHVQVQHQRHAAHQQRIGDRHPDQHRRQQRADKNSDGHGRAPFFLSWTCGSCASPWCSCSTIARSSDSEIFTRSSSAIWPDTSSHSCISRITPDDTAKTTPAP